MPSIRERFRSAASYVGAGVLSQEEARPLGYNSTAKTAKVVAMPAMRSL